MNSLTQTRASALIRGRIRWQTCWTLACLATLVAPAQAALKKTPPRPVATISVTPLGFRPLGSVYTLLRLSSLSLDFIDDTHLLFTYHQSQLMSREEEQGHDDQTIRAAVIEIPSATVGAKAEWRMHDRRQYLFPLGDGSFLLRQGNDFSRLGSDLKLHPYIHFQNRLVEAQISPEGRVLTVQSDRERHSEEKHKRLVAEAIANGDSFPDEDVDIQMVSLEHRQVLVEAKSDAPLRLAVGPAGYIDQVQAGESEWKLKFHRFGGTAEKQQQDLIQLHSTCAPVEDFLNSTTLMVAICSTRTSDRHVTALTTDGKQLWQGDWDGHWIQPNFGLSAGGGVFAVSWIVATHPVDAFFSLSDGDIQGQEVQVLSTSTGHLLLGVPASPVSSAGQNFALSADGKTLAVLNKGAIEIYDVPADIAK